MTPSLRARQLARQLRTLRTAAALQGKDAAQRLGWSPSKISRIETGRIGISPEDLELLIQLYEVPPPQVDYLRGLLPAARARGWWDAFADTLGSGYANLLKLEADAHTLQSYCAVVPHAMLLTPDYARRVILVAPQQPSPPEVERRVEIVRLRQKALYERQRTRRLQLAVVIDEAVLHRRVVSAGGAKADKQMVHRQLQHLADVADAEPNVTIQVLPFATGLPPVSTGSFSILGFAATAPDIVYLENKTRTFFIEAETEVHAYVQDFRLLSEWALDPRKSAAFIRKAISRVGRE